MDKFQIFVLTTLGASTVMNHIMIGICFDEIYNLRREEISLKRKIQALKEQT